MAFKNSASFSKQKLIIVKKKLPAVKLRNIYNKTALIIALR
jgi:hypothetical protein